MWGTVFASEGDSGCAVITANTHQLCGNIISGPLDNQVTYISDALENLEAIRESTGADEVFLA